MPQRVDINLNRGVPKVPFFLSSSENIRKKVNLIKLLAQLIDLIFPERTSWIGWLKIFIRIFDYEFQTSDEKSAHSCFLFGKN